MEKKPGIERLIRPHLRGFTGYSASTSPDTLEGKIEVSADAIVKLNANENPYGCSPRVLKALADNPELHIYPDDGQQVLRGRLAQYVGVPAERIVAGHGSNTLIDYIVRLFIGPGDEVINFPPTFDLYRFSTAMYGGTLVNIDRDSNNFSIDVEKTIASITEKTKLVFLATPNNPTGTVTPQNDIRRVLDTGLPLVVDEAYGEFSGETLIPLINEYDNLIVLRTFSKWAGLAGLRVGYGVFPVEIARYLMAIKIPHNVSAAAETAVRESLSDIEYLNERVQAIVKERERLFQELQKIPFLTPVPSRANFVFCLVKDGNATALHDALERKGVLIRNFKTSVRISAGTPAQTDKLLQALRSI